MLRRTSERHATEGAVLEGGDIVADCMGALISSRRLAILNK